MHVWCLSIVTICLNNYLAFFLSVFLCLFHFILFFSEGYISQLWAVWLIHWILKFFLKKPISYKIRSLVTSNFWYCTYDGVLCWLNCNLHRLYSSLYAQFTVFTFTINLPGETKMSMRKQSKDWINKGDAQCWLIQIVQHQPPALGNVAKIITEVKASPMLTKELHTLLIFEV